MLRGLRTAIQYFTIGLALGLLIAPRKGDETRALLLDQLRSYMQDAMSARQGGSPLATHHPEDATRGAYRVGQTYGDAATTEPQ
jgi:hypothetical protein